MENFLPFTEDVIVVLVHKCAQQTHLLALHLETLGYIPRLLNALNGLVYFLIIGDPRGDNLMVGSISRKLLTELGIRTEDAECKLMGDKCNFVIFVLIIKNCLGKYHPKTSNQHKIDDKIVIILQRRSCTISDNNIG